MFDEASGYTLGNVPEDMRDHEDFISSWAVIEGQILHDMVSYTHRLAKHPGTTDAAVAVLKQLCPNSPKTRKRTHEETDLDE